MNKHLLITVIIFYASAAAAQNLVPNGSFETYSNCPGSATDISLAIPWVNGNLGTPDYCNQCATVSGFSVPSNYFGIEQAHTGVAYGGIVLYYSSSDYREYIEVPLTETLEQGGCYHFEMYLNLGEEYSKYTTDDIGVYFSSSQITGSSTLPLLVTPQLVNTAGNYPDTAGWTVVSGTYVAAGTEHYMTIGNFETLANTNIVLINNSVSWEESYAFVDDVSLTSCETGVKENFGSTGIEIYPNPFTNTATLILPRQMVNQENNALVLYDVFGRQVQQYQIESRKSEISRENIGNGVYFYNVISDNKIIDTGKIIIE